MKNKIIFFGTLIGLIVGQLIERVFNICSSFECCVIVPPIFTTILGGIAGGILGYLIERFKI